MTQYDLFPQENQEKPILTLLGLLTGGRLAQPSRDGFFSQDFQHLDAATHSPLGAHVGYDSYIFASTPYPGR